MSTKKGEIKIGTSGWSYDWEDFYPEELSKDEYLGYFSSKFNTAEVNYSFYQLPKTKTYEKWAQETDGDFVFALKLSRYITHMKRLKGIKEELRKFLKHTEPLGGKRGPILVQMHPNFKIDVERLKYFLETAEDLDKELDLKPKVRYAFEFRHPEWFEESEKRDEALKMLSRHNACFVFGHSSKYPYPEDEPNTADFVYFRFHGPREFAASQYGEAELQPYADKMKKHNENGLDVFAYFNNDMNGYATEDAQKLVELVEDGK